MKNQILSVLPGDHPWQNSILYYEELPSTNDLAKQLAQGGAPGGTVILAGSQTAGRGRLGRSFYAPKDMGLYMSVILRPCCKPDALMTLTCAVAVAACDAVEKACGVRPRIKWTNDLVVGNKKAGGILTELSADTRTGLVQWVVVGIGINCNHTPRDFPPALQEIATSLKQITGDPLSPGLLAAQVMSALEPISRSLTENPSSVMEQYRRDCMTVGQAVMLLRNEEKRYGTALAVNDDGSLAVRFEDGSVENVAAGEISVRGFYGYL